MTNEKFGFTEQAINKIAAVALSKLLDVKQLSVQIKTDLKQLARGEIEAMMIELYDMKLRQDLRVEALKLQIGRITVKPRKAALGKIELVHPSEGSFHVFIREQQLTAALNAESFRQSLSQQRNVPGIQAAATNQTATNQIEQVRCALQANGAIALICEERLPSVEKRQSGTVLTRPRIEAEGKAVVLDVEAVEGDLSPGTVSALVAQVNDILSLHDLSNRGTVLHIQQVDVAAGSVTIRASAHIEQFPAA